MDTPRSMQFMDAPHSLIPGPGDRIFYGERARTYFLIREVVAYQKKQTLPIRTKIGHT